ncbi:MAG TPA: T9SS type A sorting domain-containing protein, partial [Candidatus Cloacimonadota bacterium]|nr:T9SS type A sorting domain-containing protein [Candidatus Cloacimonadota bacterium]
IQAPVANDDPFVNPVPGLSLMSYPNPFNPQTTLRYNLKRTGELELTIYNVRGELVHKVRGFETEGSHSYLWNAENLPSGSYLVRLKSGSVTASLRVQLIK